MKKHTTPDPHEAAAMADISSDTPSPRAERFLQIVGSLVGICPEEPTDHEIEQEAARLRAGASAIMARMWDRPAMGGKFPTGPEAYQGLKAKPQPRKPRVMQVETPDRPRRGHAARSAAQQKRYDMVQYAAELIAGEQPE